MSTPRTWEATSPGDLATAARLLVAFNAEYDEPAPPAGELADHLAALVAGGGTHVHLLAEDGGEPAGVAVLRVRTSTWTPTLEGYLAELYVAPDQRGRGLGETLLRHVLDRARERGVTYVDLTTTEADEAAVRLYERLGFDCHEGRGHGPVSRYYELDL